MSYLVKPALRADGTPKRVRGANGGPVLEREGISIPERTSYWIRRENDDEVVITVETTEHPAAESEGEHPADTNHTQE